MTLTDLRQESTMFLPYITLTVCGYIWSVYILCMYTKIPGITPPHVEQDILCVAALLSTGVHFCKQVSKRKVYLQKDQLCVASCTYISNRAKPPSGTFEPKMVLIHTTCSVWSNHRFSRHSHESQTFLVSAQETLFAYLKWTCRRHFESGLLTLQRI